MAKSKTKNKDTHSYKGWLNSDNFFKRAFAIYGYTIVAGLLIAIPFYILMVVLFVIIGIASFAV